MALVNNGTSSQGGNNNNKMLLIMVIVLSVLLIFCVVGIVAMMDSKKDDTKRVEQTTEEPVAETYVPEMATHTVEQYEEVYEPLTFRTFVGEFHDDYFGTYQCRLEYDDIVRNLKKLGFEFVDSRTENRYFDPAAEYYDVTIEIYSRTTSEGSTTVALENGEWGGNNVSIHFPTLSGVKDFEKTIKGLKKTKDGYESVDSDAGTAVDISGTVVTLWSWVGDV